MDQMTLVAEEPVLDGENCQFPVTKIDNDCPNLDFPRFANPATLHASKCTPPGLLRHLCMETKNCENQ